MSNRIQEWYSKMYAGLESQNWEKSQKGIMCRFRGDNGRKCAVGHIIDDDVARCLEGTGPICQMSEYQLSQLGFGTFQRDELMFLRDAQGRHDSSTCPRYMKIEFEQLGKAYGVVP